MSPTSRTDSSASASSEPRFISNAEISTIHQRFSQITERLGFEVYPFKIKWYNDTVAPEYRLDYHEDTLAFVVLSTPSMFEEAFLPFLANVLGASALESELKHFDPIDRCMQYYFDILQKKLSRLASNAAVEKIHDFELQMPYRRPRILLQTAAHVSGAAYYYRLVDKRHRLGVCVHPSYGGWFGIRGAFVLAELLAKDLVQRPPPNVVPDEEKQRQLLKLFNEQWRDWTYRDVIPVKSRYSSLQKQYFQLLPRERLEFLRTRILPILPQYKSSALATTDDHDWFL